MINSNQGKWFFRLYPISNNINILTLHRSRLPTYGESHKQYAESNQGNDLTGIFKIYSIIFCLHYKTLMLLWIWLSINQFYQIFLLILEFTKKHYWILQIFKTLTILRSVALLSRATKIHIGMLLQLSSKNPN